MLQVFVDLLEPVVASMLATLKVAAFTVILLWSSRHLWPYLYVIVIGSRSALGVCLPLLSEFVSWWSSFDALTSSQEQLRVFLGLSPALVVMLVGFACCCAVINSSISILSPVVSNLCAVWFLPQAGLLFFFFSIFFAIFLLFAISSQIIWWTDADISI